MHCIKLLSHMSCNSNRRHYCQRYYNLFYLLRSISVETERMSSQDSRDAEWAVLSSYFFTKSHLFFLLLRSVELLFSPFVFSFGRQKICLCVGFNCHLFLTKEFFKKPFNLMQTFFHFLTFSPGGHCLCSLGPV